MHPVPVVSRGQRAAAASLPSLGLIAVSFFLPFVRICGNMQTPAGYAAESEPLTLLWLAPRFLAAALLAVPLAFAVWRNRAPGRRAGQLGFLAVAGTGVGLALDWALLAEALDHGAWAPVWMAWLCVATLGGALATLRAWRHRGYERAISQIGAFALFASPLCLLPLDGILYSASGRAVGVGGYGFLIAIVLLIVLFAVALWPGKAPPQDQPGEPPVPPPVDEPPPPVDAPN